MLISEHTIAAIATANGNSGVGIIRISGQLALNIAKQFSQRMTFTPRYAHFCHFYETSEEIIDSGLIIYFPAPHSYTGEDIIEIQAHGGQIVLNLLLRRVLALGARLAAAGEFTQRAFLNGKLDLTQAEAIADLINSDTEQAVRCAQRSIQGVFSEHITQLSTAITQLRIYLEAAIDFVDEEIDFLSEGKIADQLQQLNQQLDSLKIIAHQGQLLNDGMTIVLAGKPNAGKSSLLNALAGQEVAIVTAIAGTTRDVLRERIQIDGIPLHIIDTAGLRDSDNIIEQEGIRRAHLEIAKADRIVFVIDSRETDPDPALLAQLPKHIPLTFVFNKIDLINKTPYCVETSLGTSCYLSLKPENGLQLLRDHLKKSIGFSSNIESVFIARKRHLIALENTQLAIQQAIAQLHFHTELVAEELRIAHQFLGEIVGHVSADDLLGKIFAEFCIGK
ncbi:MAG: hypothetical protein RL637_1721 [Pseudomonadota bacterium]|jgi:tRNA modification GTPase